MEPKSLTPTPERILCIAAHADDIEFGAAGSVARWAHEGAEITYCIVTDNSAGSNEPGADLAALVETRRREQEEAAAVLGVKDVRFLGYRDGVLEPTMELRKKLTRLIREIRPQRVVTLDPTTVFFGDGYINHPDHRAAGEAATYAVFPSAGTRPIFPELLDEGLEPHNINELFMTLTFRPMVYVDITDFMETKIEALLKHKSQVGEDVADWVREMSAESGKRPGYQYAEAFRVISFNHDERPDLDDFVQAESQAEEEPFSH